MNAKRRLERLEARMSARVAAYEVPPEVSIVLKMSAREEARWEGREPPPYTPEELEELRADDIEDAAGRGVVGELRGEPGWRSPESQRTLDGWKEDARKRLSLTAELPPQRWGEVYEEAF